ncbi:hypothetical protein Y032_0002g861 [Ancylostoma ceylanicum]|nr:hypothetical protein Y032_0002g861 [Ancylostoma ceylanicum]
MRRNRERILCARLSRRQNQEHSCSTRNSPLLFLRCISSPSTQNLIFLAVFCYCLSRIVDITTSYKTGFEQLAIRVCNLYCMLPPLTQ